MSTKTDMAETVDANIADYQNKIAEFEQAARAAEAGTDWPAIQEARNKLLAAQNQLHYWLTYKEQNPILWEPEPEEPVTAKNIDPYVPAVSMRQLWSQAAARGFITEDEALAAMSGTIPARIADMVDNLPVDEAFASKMLLKSGEIIAANSMLASDIGQVFGLDENGQKEFFADAAKI